MTDETGGARLEAIWVKTAQGGPMRSVPEGTLVAGSGLEGNANLGGYRQVTVLDADAWQAATEEAGADVGPEARRANLLVRGLDLAETRDRVLKVAGCRIAIRGETLPCERMDEAAPGLKEALRPSWRGGVYGMVLEGGPVALGDAVAFEA